MLRLIQFLIFGHIHKWKTSQITPLKNNAGERGQRAYCVCEKCGAHRMFDMM